MVLHVGDNRVAEIKDDAYGRKQYVDLSFTASNNEDIEIPIRVVLNASLGFGSAICGGWHRPNNFWKRTYDQPTVFFHDRDTPPASNQRRIVILV